MKPKPYRAPWILVLAGLPCLAVSCAGNQPGGNIHDQYPNLMLGYAGLILTSLGCLWIGVRRTIYWLF